MPTVEMLHLTDTNVVYIVNTVDLQVKHQCCWDILHMSRTDFLPSVLHSTETDRGT